MPRDKSPADLLSPAGFRVLLALSDRPRHGLGIVDEVERRTAGEETLGPGTLYGTIKRLTELAMIEETREAPDPDDDDTRRRYYRITDLGLEACRAEALSMRRLLAAAESKQII